MVQKIVTELIDDIDGNKAAETVQFGLDGKTYEIDLSDKNAKALRSSLEKYVTKGRRQKRAYKPRSVA